MPSVLIVEDHAPTRDLLRGILEGENYTVETAEDGETAIRRLHDEHFDAIVLDIVLPGMSGIDLMERLSGRAPETIASVVVVTGLDVKEIRTLFPSVCDTLSKPVMPGRLLASVRRCFAG